MSDGYQPFGEEWEKEMMKFSKSQLIETLKQHLSVKADFVECRICECDFEDNWVKFEVPQHVMNEGFHAGSAMIDFNGVQALPTDIDADASKPPECEQCRCTGNGSCGHEPVDKEWLCALRPDMRCSCCHAKDAEDKCQE